MPGLCNPPSVDLGGPALEFAGVWPEHDWVTVGVRLNFGKDYYTETVEHRRCRRCGDESEVTTPGTARAEELGAFTRADA